MIFRIGIIAGVIVALVTAANLFDISLSPTGDNAQTNTAPASPEPTHVAPSANAKNEPTPTTTKQPITTEQPVTTEPVTGDQKTTAAEKTYDSEPSVATATEPAIKEQAGAAWLAIWSPFSTRNSAEKFSQYLATKTGYSFKAIQENQQQFQIYMAFTDEQALAKQVDKLAELLGAPADKIRGI